MLSLKSLSHCSRGPPQKSRSGLKRQLRHGALIVSDKNTATIFITINKGKESPFKFSEEKMKDEYKTAS